jgi:hypothetical protein
VHLEVRDCRLRYTRLSQYFLDRLTEAGGQISLVVLFGIPDLDHLEAPFANCGDVDVGAGRLLLAALTEPLIDSLVQLDSPVDLAARTRCG